jgi:hypothetical protein
MSALLYLYKGVLALELLWMARPDGLPPDAIRRIFAHLEG